MRGLALAAILISASSCPHQGPSYPGAQRRGPHGVGEAATGKVLAVRPEVNLAMISLGCDHGVSTGRRFWVYRGGKLVGYIELEQVFADKSSARMLGGSWSIPLQEGDDVSPTRRDEASSTE